MNKYRDLLKACSTNNSKKVLKILKKSSIKELNFIKEKERYETLKIVDSFDIQYPYPKNPKNLFQASTRNPLNLEIINILFEYDVVDPTQFLNNIFLNRNRKKDILFNFILLSIDYGAKIKVYSLISYINNNSIIDIRVLGIILNYLKRNIDLEEFLTEELVYEHTIGYILLRMFQRNILHDTDYIAIHMLLESGSDPNQYINGIRPLWLSMFNPDGDVPVSETPWLYNHRDIRYKTLVLFFKYGFNPFHHQELRELTSLRQRRVIKYIINKLRLKWDPEKHTKRVTNKTDFSNTYRDYNQLLDLRGDEESYIDTLPEELYYDIGKYL